MAVSVYLYSRKKEWCESWQRILDEAEHQLHIRIIANIYSGNEIIQ